MTASSRRARPFDWTDPAATRAHWQCPLVDMAGIPLAANQNMLIDVIQQSLASTEEYIYRMLTAAILPVDCKITMHQFRTAMHANLASITA